MRNTETFLRSCGQVFKYDAPAINNVKIRISHGTELVAARYKTKNVTGRTRVGNAIARFERTWQIPEITYEHTSIKFLRYYIWEAASES
jgi:hypothetical protein